MAEVPISDYIVDHQQHHTHIQWVNYGKMEKESNHGDVLLLSVNGLAGHARTPHSHSAKSTNQLTNEHHHHRPFTPMNMNDRPTPDPPHSSSFLCCCFFCNSLWFISFSAASLIVFISVLYWVKCKTWLHCSPHPAEPTMSLPVESWAIFCVPCCCGKYRTLTFNHPMTPFDPDLSRLWLLCGRAGATYFD